MNRPTMILILALMLLAAPLYAQVSVSSRLVADGFEQPLYVTSHPENAGKLYVVEKTGRIWIVEDGQVLPEPFLDLSDKVSTNGERGLLGLAFHYNFQRNGIFFVYYTDVKGDTRVSRFKVFDNNEDKARKNSEIRIIKIGQPYANHNGGCMQMGPDRYLYISMGDGGGGGDPDNNGQDLSNPLGALLRVAIERLPYTLPPDNPFLGPAGYPTIFAYGLRNGWRFSFDRETGDLWIADVGQNAVEEINALSIEEASGGNFGWNIYEGSLEYSGEDGGGQEYYIWPVYEYSHDSGMGRSVTGGYVYRGKAIPSLYGHYVFGDFISGRIFAFKLVDGEARQFKELTAQLVGSAGSTRIVSFGEDADGELYFCDFITGGVYKIVP